MKEKIGKLKNKKYLSAILIAVLLVFVIGLISILKPTLKNIKINSIKTKTSSLNASVIDGVSEEVISNNYDEIKYTIKVNKDATDTAVIIATLTDQEAKYARFKKIENSEVSENGKKITITTTKERTNVIIIVENAPYGTEIKPNFKINSEDENRSSINVEPVTITGKSVEGTISDENGRLYPGLELSLTKNNDEVKRTYSKDNGEYVFSLGDTEDYQVSLAEEKYKVVRYEEATFDSNKRIINIVIKEVEPFKLNIKKTINKLDLVVNDKKEIFTYDDETKVVKSIKNAKTIEGSIYYNISVKNEGEVKGTLTVLKDKVPEGLSFDENKNPGWTKDGGYLFYTPLEDKEIGAFEKENISLVLDIVKTSEAKNYINTAISSGEDYKYVAYYLNNNIFREEYVINSDKLENIDPGIDSFDGWYTDKKYTNKYDFNSPVTKDTILFGKIKNNKYSVTFIDKNPSNGVETILDVVEVNEGEPVELVNHPEYNGYTFKCFKINNNCYSNENITDNVNLVTSYDINNYGIVYDLDGGELETGKINPTTYTVNDEITLNNPSKEGFTFIGWTGTDLTEETENVTIARGSTGNRSYTANYEIKKSTLTINPNGGTYNGNSSIFAIEKNYGTIMVIDPSEKRGYEFKRYNKTGGGIFSNNTYTFNEENGELTAEYEIITYDISYDNITPAERNTLNNPINYNVETETFTLSNPSTRVDEQGNESEDFVGWDDGSGNVSNVVTIAKGSIGNKTYTAVWKDNENEYAIRYNLHDGQYEIGKTNPNTYTRQTETFTLNNPGKIGYEFAGWSGTGITGTSTSVTITKGSAGDRNYEAHYDLIPYTITYVMNDGILPSGVTNPTGYTVESETINLINPSKEGYEFEGWSGTGIEGKSKSVTIPTGSIGNREYTANFKKIEYSLSYTLNGGDYESGKTNPSKYYVDSDNISLNNPIKNGYEFAGWSGTGLTEQTLSVTIPTGSTGDRAYEAHYEPTIYNITYDYDGGDLEPGKTNPETYTIESPEITFNTPVKEGYIFTNYTSNNEIITNIPTGSTGDKTLKANYQKRKYNVNYYNGESIYWNEQVEWNDVATAPSVNPSKAHNIFLYWSLDGTNEFDFTTSITADTNLYAVYEEIVAPTITISPSLDVTTNKTYACGDSNNEACGVTVTVTSSNPEYTLYYQIGDSSPVQYTQAFKVYENTTITAFSKKNDVYSVGTEENIANIDTIGPIINTPETGSTPFSLTITGTSSDSGSGVKKIKLYLKEKDALDYDDTFTYETEIFDGIKDQSESYNHTFSGIQNGTEYMIKIVSEDYVGNVTEREIDLETNPYVARIVGMNGILWYTVDPDTKEFIVDDGKEFLLYDSIQSAINACGTVQCTIQTNPIVPITVESVTVGTNQDVTIDLDGRGIVSDASATIVNNGKLTIVDRNPRLNDQDEHDGIGTVKNTVGKAIVNNGTFTLGEGSSEESETFITPEADRPIIEGKTNALEQNDKFYFYDGKLVTEGTTVIVGTGEDAITQYMYNAILTAEGEKQVAILDKATDPEAKIRSTYYAKLKINNDLNAVDSAKKGTITTESAKMLSKIKQYGDYGFTYDVVNDQIYNDNHTTRGMSSISYIKLDLTKETEDKYIIFDAFADTYNSGSYGYIAVSDTLGDVSNKIFTLAGNDAVRGRLYKLEKGKVHYVHFGFVKESTDISVYEKFIVSNFGFLETRTASAPTELITEQEHYPFKVQEDGSYINTNIGTGWSYSHSYLIYDLRDVSNNIDLYINTDIDDGGRGRGYIYISNDEAFQTTGTVSYTGQQNNITNVFTLEAGKINYVHFGFYSNGNGTFTINSIILNNAKSENTIIDTQIAHNQEDTYYFIEDTDKEIWKDVSSSENDGIGTRVKYDSSSNSFVFKGNGIITLSKSMADSFLDTETVEVEFSTTSSGTQVLYMGGNNERIGIGIANSAIVVSNVDAAPKTIYNIPSDYADGNRHKIVIIYNNGTYSAYFDDAPMTVKSGSYFLNGRNANTYIGGKSNGSNFTGTIYGVKVYNRALTEEEVIDDTSTEGLILNLNGINSDYYPKVYTNNNIGRTNTTAHSYLVYDLTNINEDKYLYVLASIDCRATNKGIVQVTNSPDMPSNTNGREISISGVNEQSAIFKLKKNQVNYVHFIYSVAGYSGGNDEFIIKELKYCNSIEDAYSIGYNTHSYNNMYYFEKPIVNTNVDTIELLKDVTINTSIEIPEEQEVILDLNGHTLTSSKSDYIIKNNGKITVTDSEYIERHNQNVDYETEQSRLYNEARTSYLADLAEYTEYAGACDNCEPSDEYKFDHLEDYKDYFGISDVTEEYTFDYVSDSDDKEQTFVIPNSGLYKLEVWGAQGGTTKSYVGGFGSYSVGAINLNKNDILYINVGGQGTGSSATTYIPGGYNGGGTGKGGDCGGSANNRYGASGGGATSISTVSGELKDLDEENDKDNVLIVAGGGGGAVSMVDWYQGAGGSGGGFVGVNGYVNRTDTGFMLYSTGGSQTAGGSGGTNYAESSITPINTGGFGFGGSSPDWETCGQGGAGGGGFYGGGAGVDMSGAGGSGYIGNEELLDKKMVCYNCTTSSDYDTLTESTTCKNATPTTDCAKQNSGYAKITLLFNQDEVDAIRDNLPKRYNVKIEPKFRDYLTGIDFDSSVDIDELTPDSTPSYNIDESVHSSIITTIENIILNEQYATFILEAGNLDINVNGKIGIINRGHLVIGPGAIINANFSGTTGIFNETNGSMVFNGGVVNANGSSTTGILNRSNTPSISNAKVVTSSTDAVGFKDEALEDITYTNLNITGSGTGLRMFNGGDTIISNSNIKSTGNNSADITGEGRLSKLNVINSNFYGTFIADRTPKEIIISNSTLTKLYNLMGNVTLNSSTVTDQVDNRGIAVINNSTINSSGTAINNYANPVGTGQQFNANLIVNNSIINSTATSAVNVIINNDKMNIHNVTVNNISGTASTAFNNAATSGNNAYLSIDGDTIIDNTFGTAINNTGLLTLGTNKNNVGEVYNYGYTGHQEEFVAPETGTYKLETWGASGAEITYRSYGNIAGFKHGGYGGYASGTIQLTAGQKLYIHVGGIGAAGGYDTGTIAFYSAYNGGGVPSNGVLSRDYIGAGGGATDISLSDEDNSWSYDNGLLTNKRSITSYEQRIIVAGGGSGGDQTSSYGGYSLDPSTSQLGYGARSGGGGYYGGSSGIGGSSYVSNTLTDIVMIPGNQEMPDYDSSGIIKGNMGNGYAKITLIDSSSTDTVTDKPTISAVDKGITGAGRIRYYDGIINAKVSIDTHIEETAEGYDIYISKDENDNENLILLSNASTKPVEQGEEEYVAAIGNTKYTTVQNAVDAAIDGDEIDLLVDINQQNTITIPDNKNLTIDYNGHVITSFNLNTLFHNIHDENGNTVTTGTIIKDSTKNYSNNYWYGKNYFINDGKLTIKDLQFYDKPTVTNFLTNNADLTFDRVNVYFGFSDLQNLVCIKNTTTGTALIKDSNLRIYGGWNSNRNITVVNDGTITIKDTILSSTIDTRSGGKGGNIYFVKNSITGNSTLDNISLDIPTRGWYETYYLSSNDGTLNITNINNIGIENVTSTGTVNLTNNTITAGTISSSGLVNINSGIYANTFNINGTGVSIDNTADLYSLIMNGGTVNSTLNISSTGISNIKSGTISVASGAAINNTSDGVINLGIQDGMVDPKASTKPVITGKTYGIYTNNPNLLVNFYDGIISGEHSYNVTIGDIETGYSVRREYDSTTNTETKYLTDEPLFANITKGTEYATIAEFNDALANGLVDNDDVINVLRDMTITKNENPITIPSGLKIIFDLNNKVVDKNNETMFIINGELSIRGEYDPEDPDTGFSKIDSTIGNIFINNNKLNIISGCYISERDTKEVAIIQNSENAILTISDGYFTKYYDKLDELSQMDRGYGAIINNSGIVTVTGGEYVVNSSHRGGYLNRIANYIYTSNIFFNTSTGVINASNMKMSGFASVDINADNKAYGSSISYQAEGQIFNNAGILNISDSVSSNSLIGDNTGTVVMENITMTKISHINNIWDYVRHKPIVNSGTFTIKGGNYSTEEQIVKNSGTFIITTDSLGNGTVITRTANGYKGNNNQGEDADSYRIIYNKGTGNVEIDNATFLSDSVTTSSIVMNTSSGYVEISDSILRTNNYPVISNQSSGTIEINNSELSSISGNGIDNTSTGSVHFYGNNTTVTSGAVGINNTSSGTITIGQLINDDGALSQTYPLIVANTYGIKNSATGTINFFDGLIKGKTAARSGAISYIEPNYALIEPTTTTDDYYIAYLDKIYVIENVNNPSEKYYSIAEAFANAIDGDEFRMIANYSTTIDAASATNTKNITLDLNGYTITQGNDSLITNNGTLTITDNSADNLGRINASSGTKSIDNYGSFIIEGGNLYTDRDILIINNNAGGTVTVQDKAIIDTATSSLLITNNGTVNIYNGAYLHSSSTIIQNNSVLNIVDLNKDDDPNTTSNLTAPRVYSTNRLETGNYYPIDNYRFAAIKTSSGSTTTIYGGIFNNGETYATGTPDLSVIIQNQGTANIKNLDNYSFVIGYSNGIMNISDSHLYNFTNNALTSQSPGVITIKDTVIDVTNSNGKNILNWGTLYLDNVDISMRSGNSSQGLIYSGSVHIKDSRITSDDSEETIKADYIEIENSTINSTGSLLYTGGTAIIDSSNLTSTGTIIAGNGNITLKNNTNILSTGGNAINNYYYYAWDRTYFGGTINILSNVSIISKNGIGIYTVDNGTVNIGEIGGTPDTTTPYIEGTTYGIYNEIHNGRSANVNFYDGLVVGQTGPNAINGVVSDVASGYETTDVVVVDPNDGLSKHNEYLVLSATSVSIANVGTYTFSSNGSINSSQALQNAINFAVGDGTNVKTVELLADVDLTVDEVSITATAPVTVNTNGHTVTTNTTYNFSSNINLNSSNLGGSVSKLLSDTFGITQNPKNIIVYEMSDGSQLDVNSTYKLYRDGSVISLEKEEFGRYRYRGDTEDLIPIKGRLYLDNLQKGSYRLTSSDNKYIEFSIDSDGNISGNVIENPNDSESSSAIANSKAELILTIQTGIKRHYYFLILIPIALLIFILMKINKNKKREII